MSAASFPWLSVLMGFPLLGAVLLAVLPRRIGTASLPKVLGLGIALVTLALTLAMFTQYDAGAPGFQLSEQHEWIGAFGAFYALGVDGIGVTLVLLTAILTPVVLLASWRDGDPDATVAARPSSGAHRAGTNPPRGVDTRTPTGPRRRWSDHAYVAWMLALEGLAIGVFAATDVFLFYVLFEATLIPVYFLIGGFGGPRRSYAAVKFLLYSLFGGLLMLASVVGLYVVSARAGEPSYLLTTLRDVPISESTGRWLFAGFFIAFAVKAPMWPVHTWLPDAAAEATPGTAVLLVSVLDKVGTFGMIRFCLQLFPEASRWAAPVIVILAVFSVIYGALLAIGQDDIRRLIAYTSVSHFGFIVLGIFAFTSQSATGATLYMFNHGLSTAALFLLAGFLVSRRGSRLVADYGGVQKVAPVLAGLLLLAGLSSLSLPGLSPFVSEFLVLAGTFTTSIPAAVIATLGIVLAALYILLMYQRTMTGPLRPDNAGIVDLRAFEVVALAPLFVLIVGLGFFPQPLIEVINPAVGATLDQVGVSDPRPDVPVTTAEESAP